MRRSSHLLFVFPPAIAAAVFVLAGQAFAFTSQQADAGSKVYSRSCGSCHGASLQGGAGPALAGDEFASSLQYGNRSAKQLFSFTEEHMPKNDPGALSVKKYLEVFSYILQENGFEADGSQLTEQNLDQVDLLPLPKQGGAE